MIIKLDTKWLWSVLPVLLLGCIEKVDLQSEVQEDFESLLVVEATITDRASAQTILLSRVYPLDSIGPLPERNANIQVAANGTTFLFRETEAGKYESINEFGALPGVDYQLDITTSNGRAYQSDTKALTQESIIEDLSFNREFNQDNEEGVSVNVKSQDPSGNSDVYYRYTYEETYKIIAPEYRPEDLIYTYVVEVLPDGTPFAIVTYSLVQKEDEQQVCYNTVKSTDIILRDTEEFIEGEDVERYRLKFLDRNDWIISHRYSILVNQFTQSREAYIYYKTLRKISGPESLLSETQPGFITGNITSLTNSNEKVVGFFEIASVASQRIYFNYADLFPGETIPPFFDDCDYFAPPSGADGVPPTGKLISALELGNKYVQENLDPMPYTNFELEGDYDLVNAFCGDCRVLGNNFPPDFWEE